MIGEKSDFHQDCHKDDRTSYVLVNGRPSRAVRLTSGLPRGLVRGLKLWLLFSEDLDEIIVAEGLEYHEYADDSQVYGHCLDDPTETNQRTHKFTACISLT